MKNSIYNQFHDLRGETHYFYQKYEMDNTKLSIYDFEQLNQLGSGSFGRVTLVRKKQDQKLYAMKSVLLSRLDQKQKQNALNQVRLLASIRIPYVISYKGAFFNSENQNLCVIMQYADGGDLQHKIAKQANQKNKGLDQMFVWKVTYQLLNACKKLHQKNIVHRDIKAANVFFANDIAKLGDLNVSKVAEQGYCRTHTGTPYYTSPQIWNGTPYTSKCDIWSLGCLMYEMCTLHPPFRASDFPSLFRKVIVGQYEQIPNTYSQEMKDFIRMCLTVDDKQRPSAERLLETSIMSGMELSLQSFRYQYEDDEIQIIDPIKCPRVLKFLNSRLPGNNFQSKKKGVGFVTKKQIDIDQDLVKPSRLDQRKILSERIINFEPSETLFKLKKNPSKKTIKLPPIGDDDVIKPNIDEKLKSNRSIKSVISLKFQQEYEAQQKQKPLTFTLKKMKTHGSRFKLNSGISVKSSGLRN